MDILIKARDEASRKANKVGKAFGGMGKMVRAAAGATIAYFSVRAMTQFAASSIRAHSEQEDATNKLRQALKSTGEAVGFTVDELKEYAKELQKSTVYGDELTLSAMSILATFKEVKGSVFKETTMLALDMSEALGQDLKSSVIQLGKALNDPATGISALSRVGVSFTQVQKDQIKNFMEMNDVAGAQGIILNELQSEFGGQAAAAVDTFSGSVRQLKNAWGDAKEKLGGYIAENEKVMYGIKTTQVLIENFDTVMELVWTSAGLSLVEWYEELKYTFTVRVPTVLLWFKDNWREIFQTLWNGTKTIFINMGKNIVDFFIAIQSWLQGDPRGFKWTALLEGFESTLKDLPKIARREITPLEEVLTKELADLQAKLTTAIKDKTKKQETAEDSGGDSPEEKKTKTGVSAAKKRLAARESRLLTMAPGATVDYDRQIAKGTDQTVKLLTKIQEGIHQIAIGDFQAGFDNLLGTKIVRSFK